MKSVLGLLGSMILAQHLIPIPLIGVWKELHEWSASYTDVSLESGLQRPCKRLEVIAQVWTPHADYRDRKSPGACRSASLA